MLGGTVIDLKRTNRDNNIVKKLINIGQPPQSTAGLLKNKMQDRWFRRNKQIESCKLQAVSVTGNKFYPDDPATAVMRMQELDEAAERKERLKLSQRDQAVFHRNNFIPTLEQMQNDAKMIQNKPVLGQHELAVHAIDSSEVPLHVKTESSFRPAAERLLSARTATSSNQVPPLLSSRA